MTAIAKGSFVRITEGTEVACKFEGETKYERVVVNEDWEGVVLEVESVMGPHATMNGGGYDYVLKCPWSDTATRVRTTFARPEGDTFVRVTRADAGITW